MYDVNNPSAQSGFEPGINRFIQGGVITAHVAHERDPQWDDGMNFGRAKAWREKSKGEKLFIYALGVLIVSAFIGFSLVIIAS